MKWRISPQRCWVANTNECFAGSTWSSWPQRSSGSRRNSCKFSCVFSLFFVFLFFDDASITQIIQWGEICSVLFCFFNYYFSEWLLFTSTGFTRPPWWSGFSRGRWWKGKRHHVFWKFNIKVFKEVLDWKLRFLKMYLKKTTPSNSKRFWPMTLDFSSPFSYREKPEKLATRGHMESLVSR